MTKPCYLYWIHLPDHNDITQDGYIGVSVNPHKRFIGHKHAASSYKDNCPIVSRAIRKYGSSLLYTILLKGNDSYCYNLEEKLRPLPRIGWNTVAGGEFSKGNTGKRMQEHVKESIIEANSGANSHKHIGKWSTPFGVYESSREAEKFIGVSRTTIQTRCHSNSPKWDEWKII